MRGDENTKKYKIHTNTTSFKAFQINQRQHCIALKAEMYKKLIYALFTNQNAKIPHKHDYYNLQLHDFGCHDSSMIALNNDHIQLSIKCHGETKEVKEKEPGSECENESIYSTDIFNNFSISLITMKYGSTHIRKIHRQHLKAVSI